MKLSTSPATTVAQGALAKTGHALRPSPAYRQVSLPAWPAYALPIVVAAACFAVGAWAFMFGTTQSGIHLATDDAGHVVVTSIDDWSPARSSGIRPGMIVVGYDGQELIRQPGSDPGPQAPAWRGATPTQCIRP